MKLNRCAIIFTTLFLQSIFANAGHANLNSTHRWNSEDLSSLSAYTSGDFESVFDVMPGEEQAIAGKIEKTEALLCYHFNSGFHPGPDKYVCEASGVDISVQLGSGFGRFIFDTMPGHPEALAGKFRKTAQITCYHINPLFLNGNTDHFDCFLSQNQSRILNRNN